MPALRAYLRLVLLCAAVLPGVDAADLPNVQAMTLTQARSLWQQHSRELELARLQVEGAQADRISADQSPNPTVSMQSLVPVTQRDTNGNDTTVGISQLIERGGKRELRTAVAEAQVQASEKDWLDTRRMQGMQLEQAYFELKRAQEVVRIDQDMVALYRASQKASELRMKEGDVPMADVTRLRVEALRLENQLQQDALAVRKAQIDLGYLLGLTPEVSARLQAVDTWPRAQLPRTTDERIEQRPDVRAAVDRLEAARKALELARAQQTRDVTVGLSAERHVMSANTVGVNLSVPLFTNYRFEGEIARAQTEVAAAAVRLEQTRAQARQDMAQAQADLDAAMAQVQRFEGGLIKDAERAANNAEFAFRHGASGLIELLDARRTLLSTQIEAVAARTDFAKALAAWRAAMMLEETP